MAINGMWCRTADRGEPLVTLQGHLGQLGAAAGGCELSHHAAAIALVHALQVVLKDS